MCALSVSGIITLGSSGLECVQNPGTMLFSEVQVCEFHWSGWLRSYCVLVLDVKNMHFSPNMANQHAIKGLNMIFFTGNKGY